MSSEEPSERAPTSSLAFTKSSQIFSVDVSAAQRSHAAIRQRKAAFRSEGDAAVKRVGQELLVVLERFRRDLDRHTDRFRDKDGFEGRQVSGTSEARTLTQSRDAIHASRREWCYVLDAVYDGKPPASLWSIVGKLRNIAFQRHDKPLRNSDKDVLQVLDIVPHWTLDLLDAAIDILRELTDPPPTRSGGPGESTSGRRAGAATPNNANPPAKAADEAVERLGDEWATIRQLADVTGKSESSIRSALKRAKKKRDWLGTDEQPIPDARPRTARFRYRIRGAWGFLPLNSKRSRK